MLSSEQFDDLVAALADAVADRLADRLAGAQRSASGLVDAAALAVMLGVSRECVYRHAAELGGRRIGTGDRGRLRFEPGQALERWTARHGSESSQGSQEARNPSGGGHARPSARPRRRRALGGGVDLLPIGPVSGRQDGGA
jgi:hypothetical protein